MDDSTSGQWLADRAALARAAWRATRGMGLPVRLMHFFRRASAWGYYRALHFRQRVIGWSYYRRVRLRQFYLSLRRPRFDRQTLQRFAAGVWTLAQRNRVLRYLTGYDFCVLCLMPLNVCLAFLRRAAVYPHSVLHISYMIHVPYEATRLLRRHGMKADYLACGGPSKVWNRADYTFVAGPYSFVRAWQEFVFFWKVVAKYEIVHTHFGIMLTTSGWEYPVLKRLGRKIVVHYRGCEVRCRERNMALHPDVNICQQCDYNAEICTEPIRRQRVALSRRYGDLFLVTTPDMKDFVPDATHMPFFLPQLEEATFAAQSRRERRPGDPIKIVHVTGHPGIEGTDEIRAAIERLKAKGYPLQFVFLHIVAHVDVLREMADADLSIGKMKMGYYANAQIESMFFGVPTITYVRPEFMTSELERSGFIFTTLPELERTLEYYLTHPEELARKRAIARESILRLHDNEVLGKQMVALYRRTKES